MKRILIVAGPNGAGKTTFATQYLSREAGFPAFVNADLIATGLNPVEAPFRGEIAGRLMLERIHDLAERGLSFAFETTLAGRAALRWIPRWREGGYQVNMLYLWLSSVELAVARVRTRVEQGGHDVPEPIIRRRFSRGWTNFRELYRPIVDRWAVYDNSGKYPLLVERGGSASPSAGTP